MDVNVTSDAGNLALDLLNTGPDAGTGAVDDLGTPRSVLDWLARSAVIDGATAARLGASPPRARELQREAVQLRDALRALIIAAFTTGAYPPRSLLALNRVLEARVLQVRIEERDGRPTLLSTAQTGAVRGLLAPVVEAAVRLLDEAPPERVRRCDAPDCRLWFVDSSRNGRRRWCSMATCGNRAKVARHYRRSRAEGGLATGHPGPYAG